MDKLILGYLCNDPALEPEMRDRVIDHLDACLACSGKMLAIQEWLERRDEDDD